MPSYQSTGSRDPVWTQVACDPEDGLVVANERYQGSAFSTEAGHYEYYPKRKVQKKGLNMMSAAVFIVGEMAGSGVLALPRAVVNSEMQFLNVAIITQSMNQVLSLATRRRQHFAAETLYYIFNYIQNYNYTQ